MVGCIEGRVSVHFSQETPVRFCDRVKRRPANPTASNAIGRTRTEHRWSIRSMLWKSTHRRSIPRAITPRKPCLVTGGSDGNVFFWDYKSKKRVSQIHSFPSSISSLAFNHDGSYLAIASSYLFENGKQEEYRFVFVRQRVVRASPPCSLNRSNAKTSPNNRVFVQSNNPKHLLHLIGSVLARLQRLVVHLARRKLLVLHFTLSPIPHRRLQAALEVLQLDSAHIVLPMIVPSNPNKVLLFSGSKSRLFGRFSGHRLFLDFFLRSVGRSASEHRPHSTTIESKTRFYAWPSELPAPKPKPWRIEPKKPGPRMSREHREIAESCTHCRAGSWHGLGRLGRLSSRGCLRRLS